MNRKPGSAGSDGCWYVYILRCADDTLYTGVTTDLARRLREHNSPRGGARYTRARQPVRLVHAENAACRGSACRREYLLKRLSRGDKETLIAASIPPSLPVAAVV